MIKLNINLKERSYPIYIGTDYGGIAKAMASARIGGKIVLITDTNVDRIHSEACLSAIRDGGYNVSKFVIPAGEANKNLDTVKDIYSYLIERQLDRNSTLVALGGGVVGDITGYAAATFLRGIHFVQVPTSLLAQADSSVGGKVGVDFGEKKNLVGAFYQPKFVYMNVNSLRTLPTREIKSGLAEVIKHGLIMDADFFDYIDYNAKKIFSFDEDVLQYLAKVNCSIKGKVVEEDERESGLRAVLNLGHTFGHAIESACSFKLLHGECVAIGLVAAFKMAERLQLTEQTDTIRVIRLLQKVGLPVMAEGYTSIDEAYKQMFYDKKVKNNKLNFVLPKKIGEVFQCSIDDEQLIREVLAEVVK